MSDLLISVRSVEGGWAVMVAGTEPMLFLSGAQAEAHARRIGGAASQHGAPAKVVVFDRDDRFVGEAHFPGLSHTAPPSGWS
jgi:hypothetical protein